MCYTQVGLNRGSFCEKHPALAPAPGMWIPPSRPDHPVDLARGTRGRVPCGHCRTAFRVGLRIAAVREAALRTAACDYPHYLHVETSVAFSEEVGKKGAAFPFFVRTG